MQGCAFSLRTLSRKIVVLFDHQLHRGVRKMVATGLQLVKLLMRAGRDFRESWKEGREGSELLCIQGEAVGCSGQNTD